MLTNSSGNAFNWHNAISGGSTSITSQPHFMTALANPTVAGDGMRIDVTYGGGSAPNYLSPNFFPKYRYYILCSWSECNWF